MLDDIGIFTSSMTPTECVFRSFNFVCLISIWNDNIFEVLKYLISIFILSIIFIEIIYCLIWFNSSCWERPNIICFIFFSSKIIKCCFISMKTSFVSKSANILSKAILYWKHRFDTVKTAVQTFFVHFIVFLGFLPKIGIIHLGFS